jgi:hypothetical protein
MDEWQLFIGPPLQKPAANTTNTLQVKKKIYFENIEVATSSQWTQTRTKPANATPFLCRHESRLVSRAVTSSEAVHDSFASLNSSFPVSPILTSWNAALDHLHRRAL